MKLHLWSLLLTPKPVMFPNVLPTTNLCGWAFHSCNTLPKVMVAEDKTLCPQVLVWKTSELLHSSNVLVHEVLANSSPTLCPSGCEPSPLANSLLTHKVLPSKDECKVDKTSLDVMFADSMLTKNNTNTSNKIVYVCIVMNNFFFIFNCSSHLFLNKITNKFYVSKKIISNLSQLFKKTVQL